MVWVPLTHVYCAILNTPFTFSPWHHAIRHWDTIQRILSIGPEVHLFCLIQYVPDLLSVTSVLRFVQCRAAIVILYSWSIMVQVNIFKQNEPSLTYITFKDSLHGILNDECVVPALSLFKAFLVTKPFR